LIEDMPHIPFLFTIQEMLSPLDAIKEIFEEGRGWWNSWELAQWLEYVPQKAKMGAYHSQYVPEKAFWGTY